MEKIQYSKLTYSKILLSRIRDSDRIYCLNLHNRERERIENRFLTKFRFRYLYYFQIDPRLKPFLKPYALRTIRDIRNPIRPYLERIKQITTELRDDFTLLQYKAYYLEKYEEFVKKYFIYSSMFEDKYDTEELEDYKEFLVSLKQVSLKDFCDNLFEIEENLRENNLYFHLFTRVNHADPQMKFRMENYKKASSLLCELEKEQADENLDIEKSPSLIKKNVENMDPLLLEKKFIELELDTQFIREFSDFIPSAFWNMPGYSHFELMAKAVKDNIGEQDFLEAFEKFISHYKSLKRLIVGYRERVEPKEELEENFYHNVLIKKFYFVVLQELGWNENQI